MYRQRRPDDVLLLAEAPWPAPTPTRDAGCWPTEDRPAYLRWLVSSAAQPWLPALRDLEAHRDAMVRAVNASAAQRRQARSAAVARTPEASLRERRFLRDLDNRRDAAAAEAERAATAPRGSNDWNA